MNLSQRIVLVLAFLVILVMALFPPWFFVFDPPTMLRQNFVKAERPAGYHLLFTDHSPEDQIQLLRLFNLIPEPWEEPILSLQSFSIRLDTSRLAVQIGAVVLLAAILYLALGKAKSLA
jgi:hypothetical protein